jgi:formyltetrahydrofolate deformylase
MKNTVIDKSRTGTLIISCTDRKGLIAATAGMLADHNVNIIDTQQYTDLHAGLFFQRFRFDAKDLDISRDDFRDILRIKLGRFNVDWKLSFHSDKKQIAIFVSKFEHCIYDLLLRHRLGELDCDIALVISNHEKLKEVADQFNVPFHVFPITKDTKVEQEQAEIALLEKENIDLIVLARYMQILSPAFTDRFPERIINIHHSTLPAFVGAKPYHQAYQRGVKLIGATAHYVNSELDQGPIIEQEFSRCSHKDTVDDLIRKGRDIERITLSRAVRAHLEDRVIIYGTRTVVF